MDIARVQQEILEVLVLLQTLNGTNLALLGQFLQRTLTDNRMFVEVEQLVRGATLVQLENLITEATTTDVSSRRNRNNINANQNQQVGNATEDDLMMLVMGTNSLGSSSGSIPILNDHFQGISSSPIPSYEEFDSTFIDSITDAQLDAFATVYKLQQLQSMLVKSFSVNHLMKLFEIIPSSGISLSSSASSLQTGSSEMQQLKLLEQLQQLLATQLPDTLLSVQREIAFALFGQEQEQLADLLTLSWEQFHLCRPLRLLLQMDSEEVVSFHNALPKLQPLQLIQLVQLLQSDPFTVLEFRRILTPALPSEVTLVEYSVAEVAQQQQQQPLFPAKSSQVDISQQSEDSRQGRFSTSPPPPVRVQIVEQPPEKSVYKRNLKPNPAVKLVGDESKVEGPIFVAPVLVRCDTQQDMPKLTGNSPIKTTVGRLITFKKIKVTITSHQEGGALFCLRFEARRYLNQTEYEVIHSIQSNPMMVLSHSTQLKAPTTQMATVIEVVPASGSTNGGTKVAIIGANFVDSPAARIRFDNIDVMPSYRGAGTLVCNTPKHAPATVLVTVTNDSIQWSETSAQFTYEEGQQQEQVPIATTLTKEGKFVLPIDISKSVVEAAKAYKEGGFDSFLVNSVDNHGFSVLHYAVDLGNEMAVKQFVLHGANPNIKDKHGNTPIFYSIRNGNYGLTVYLIEHGASTNVQNNEGVTPLHLSILSTQNEISKYLIQHRAWLHLSTLEGALTPLHLAVAEKQEDIAELLIKFGAHLNEEDEDGDTPLHWAVRQGSLDGAKLLLTYGADLFSANEDDETPLDLAVEIAEQDLATFLFEQQQNTKAAAYYTDGDNSIFFPLVFTQGIDMNQVESFSHMKKNKTGAESSPWDVKFGQRFESFSGAPHLNSFAAMVPLEAK